MIAIRQIHKVKSGAVTVHLSAHFYEIIVLRLDDSRSAAQSLQTLLLAAPTLTAEELREYEKIRE